MISFDFYEDILNKFFTTTLNQISVWDHNIQGSLKQMLDVFVKVIMISKKFYERYLSNHMIE